MEEQDRLIKRVNELSQRAFQNNYVTHTQFLTAREQSDLLEAAGNHLAADAQDGRTAGIWKGCRWVLYGGFPEADRRVMCFLPDYLDSDSFAIQEETEPEVIVCLHAKPLNRRFAEELTHRDYLGALMNLGLERERIGDIRAEGGEAFFCVMKENAEMICRELLRVRHTSIVCVKTAISSCSIQQEFEEREGSVSSERLDAILAMVYHLSRGKAQELVEQELVFVDGRTAFSGGYDLKPGSRVSVRGYGKFQYLGIGNQTQKGRFYARVKLWK
jgi:RNA-binding protein YlmH